MSTTAWQLVLIRDGRVVNVAGVTFATAKSAFAYLERHSASLAGWKVQRIDGTEAA